MTKAARAEPAAREPQMAVARLSTIAAEDIGEGAATFDYGAGKLPAVWALTCAAMLVLSACGGGGGEGTPSTTGEPPSGTGNTGTPEPTAPGPKAAMTAVLQGKTPWSVNTSARFTLQQTSGVAVTGALSCTSQAPQAVEVEPDCSRVRGMRLGTYAITVSGGGVSAPALVKVTPPAQPLATYNTSTIGPGTLAVTAEGRLLAWGGYDNRPGWSSTGLALPSQVANLRGGGYLTGLVAAAHGQDVTLALSEDGQVYSWGQGRTLGRSYPDAFLSAGEMYPGLVTDTAGPLQNIVAISTAANGALALTQDGAVYAWGPFSTAVLPVPDNKVPQLLSLPAKAVALASGQNWAAILLANGRVMTLRSGPGTEFYNSTGRPTTPGAVGLNVGYVVDSRTGQPLEGIVQVAAGASHGLALTREGQVLGWGQNDLGQLAQGSSGSSTPPAALPVWGPESSSQLTGIVMVAAGHGHSLALDSNGRVYSWGQGGSGQLGDGPGTPRSTNVVRTFRPELVLDASGTAPLSGVRAVYGTTANSIALMSDGRVLIWGLRSTNDLGQGSSAELPLHQGLPLAVQNEAGTGSLFMTPMAYWPDLWRRGTASP